MPTSREMIHPRVSAQPVMRELAATLYSRQRLNLNQDWRFYRCDDPSAPAALEREFKPALAGIAATEWEIAHLPHAVRLEPLNASGGRNFQGVCWYRRVLRGDAAWSGRTLYLHLDGLMQVADIFFNGVKLITHFGGYTPLTLDVTQVMKLGVDNEIAIRLDNRDDPTVPPGKPQAELDFVYFGGISRNITLEVMAPLHISDPILADRVGGGGVFVTFENVSAASADVRICVDLRNTDTLTRNGEIKSTLLDPEGHAVAECTSTFAVRPDSYSTVEQTLHVVRPRLWHPDHPDLYTLRTEIIQASRTIDEVVTRIGIRDIRFDVDEGLLISGNKFLSIGANRHQDHPYIGYALSDAAQWRDVKALRDAGFTSYRSHYPQSTAFMDACDELGLLAIVSNPGWQFVGDELFQSRALRNARLMVRRDRNRPSVILWEAALNESDNRPLAASLHAAIHEEYPRGPCYTAGDRNAHFSGSEAHDHSPPSAWDVDYLHNDATKPYWIREWGDQVDNWSDQQSANRVSRAWGERPMLTQARAHLARLDELWDSHSGTSTNGGRRLAGATLWAGIDCQRGYHHQPFYGGPMDAFRLPKFGHYLFQSQRPPIDGAMVFIANFATFMSPTHVTVFSNCEEVRLIHGERIVGVRKPDVGHRVPHPPFTFQVDQFSDEQSTMYMTGVGGPTQNPLELRAEGLVGGKVVAVHVVRPPGVARQLTLEADTRGRPLVADGSDFVRIHARVCDQHGTVCPFADDDVTFSVEGEGSVIDAPGANPMRADAGIATALVRGTTRAGNLRVTATTFGLTSATIDLTSTPPI